MKVISVKQEPGVEIEIAHERPRRPALVSVPDSSWQYAAEDGQIITWDNIDDVCDIVHETLCDYDCNDTYEVCHYVYMGKIVVPGTKLEEQMFPDMLGHKSTLTLRQTPELEASIGDEVKLDIQAGTVRWFINAILCGHSQARSGGIVVHEYEFVYYQDPEAAVC